MSNNVSVSVNQDFFFKIYLFIFGFGGSSLLCTDFGGGGAAGLLFLAVFRLLIAVASFVAEHRL